MNKQCVSPLIAETTTGWKKQLAEAVNTPQELLSILGLEQQLAEHSLFQPDFRVRVPRCYVAKMRYGDADDPLLKQVLPLQAETSLDGLLDPVADLAAMPTSGLLHKYHGRVLLVTTGACAVHCRYCFRRHFPYADASINSSQWQPALDYINNDPTISEVILSGGDPLVIDDSRLSALCEQLEQSAHVKWLRIHTRLPVVLPDRINDALCQWIEHSKLRITVVIHSNHANELGEAERLALQRLQQVGVTLLNQSVLLKGINDDINTLEALSRRLHDCAVLPYYLHMLDPVQGALHFQVHQGHAASIINGLQHRLPGFLVPQLVREVPGAASKTAIFGI